MILTVVQNEGLVTDSQNVILNNFEEYYILQLLDRSATRFFRHD